MDHVSAVIPPATHATTPSADLPPPGESNVPAPSAEQAAISDRVFTDQHPAATLLGVLTSAMVLRDVAVDTFDTSGEDEETPEPIEDDPDGAPAE